MKPDIHCNDEIYLKVCGNLDCSRHVWCNNDDIIMQVLNVKMEIPQIHVYTPYIGYRPPYHTIYITYSLNLKRSHAHAVSSQMYVMYAYLTTNSVLTVYPSSGIACMN